MLYYGLIALVLSLIIPSFFKVDSWTKNRYRLIFAGLVMLFLSIHGG
ncbi:MAG: hypothetical protein KGZ75_00800 [Syntrophomonadaceae bacterium]|nr:hypothetical protein [Syntrophomonadaceae bacterium]